ncbi:TOBE domain-containing protein, partial [Streptomyces sp. NPDC006658]|uniref:TOBE domain-containing protein n=1 Tax=Streptomyces sp. NPDC006658 TaxID=3156900 RepID=UPI0033F8D073
NQMTVRQLSIPELVDACGRLGITQVGLWREPHPETVYLGDATRFVVDLDGGGRLTALQQNLETSAADAAACPGTRVRLRWHRRHVVRLPS